MSVNVDYEMEGVVFNIQRFFSERWSGYPDHPLP